MLKSLSNHRKKIPTITIFRILHTFIGMDINIWPTYHENFCPNFFLTKVWLKNTLPTDSLDICPNFRSFFLGPSPYLILFVRLYVTNMSFYIFTNIEKEESVHRVPLCLGYSIPSWVPANKYFFHIKCFWVLSKAKYRPYQYLVHKYLDSPMAARLGVEIWTYDFKSMEPLLCNLSYTIKSTTQLIHKRNTNRLNQYKLGLSCAKLRKAKATY